MYELQSPNSKITVRPGNIVKLNRFDDECWIVNLGWFSYAGNRPINGWYLVSKAYKDKVKPLNLSDLEDIYVIEAGEVKEDYKELDPEIKKLIHDLKVQVEELSREVAQLTAEVEAKDEVIAEKGQEILELQHQINELRAQIEELESQHRLDAETIATLNSQVTAQAQIIAEKAAEIRELTARVAELAEENELLTQQHQEDLATIAQQASTIQSQAESIASLTDDNNRLTDENDRLTEENTELVAQHQEDTATIAEQQETIDSQGEQITELSGEVTELTTENTRLENQHTADQNTIQHLIDNPPGVRLQSKSVTPTASMQVVEPDSDYRGLSTVTVGAVTPPRLQSKQVAPSESTTYVTADSDYDGLSSVTVDNVTASIDPNIQPENIKKDVVIVGVEGTYDPFPYNSVGGIYITEVDEEGYPVKFLVKNLTKTASPFPIVYQKNSIAKTRIKEFIFENCIDINYMAVNNFVSGYFEGMTNVTKIELPENLLRLDAYMFYNCISLKQINIPATISTIQSDAFQGCSSLTNLTLAQGFNCNGLNVSASTRFTAETIVACLEALADRTGQTAYTITFGTTNLNKLTAEQKAIATNKNWNLA